MAMGLHRIRNFASRMIHPRRAMAGKLALLNLSTSGWYNLAKQELAPDFKITAEDVVIDVGCGGKGACLFAGQQGAAVVGLDIDPAALEELKQGMKAYRPRSFQAIASDCNPIPLPGEHATVVLAMEVLEHVNDPSALLAELVRVGRPGARYLITVPDPTSEALMHDIAPPGYWEKPNHIRVFQRDEFLGAVEGAGLLVERRFCYGFYGTMWWSLMCAVPGSHIPFGQHGNSDLLRRWNETWTCLLSSPHGRHVWQALENALPKSQAIIARKTANAD
jgi:SAM-dependent methyltransferase